jgi:hypothetical protein
MTEIDTIPTGVRWGDPTQNITNDDWEGGDNSSKLFERSRIKALAGESYFPFQIIEKSLRVRRSYM